MMMMILFNIIDCCFDYLLKLIFLLLFLLLLLFIICFLTKRTFCCLCYCSFYFVFL